MHTSRGPTVHTLVEVPLAHTSRGPTVHTLVEVLLYTHNSRDLATRKHIL